jgi:hypothetical protein
MAADQPGTDPGNPIALADPPARCLCVLDRAFLYPRLQGREIFLGLSIGIGIDPLDGIDTDTLIRHADIAMYRAKAAGRNGFSWLPGIEADFGCPGSRSISPGIGFRATASWSRSNRS